MAVQQGAIGTGPFARPIDPTTRDDAAGSPRPGLKLAERVKSLARRQLETGDTRRDAGAARVLAAIRAVADASSSDEWADTVARTLPAVNGMPVAAIMLRDRRRDRFALTACPGHESFTGEEIALAAYCTGLAEEAARQRVPVFADPAGLPVKAWQSGLAVPILSLGSLLGIACLFNTRLERVGPDQERLAEQFLAVAAPFLIAIQSRGAAAAPSNRLDRELLMAGRLSMSAHRPRIDLGGISLDPATDRSVVGEVAVSLSRTEFDLLYTLAESPKSPVSYGALQNDVRSMSNLDVAIHRLRRKLAKAPSGDTIVRTVRGKGYMLVPPAN